MPDHVAPLLDQQAYRHICATLQKRLQPITLVAVSKTRPAAAISALYQLGQRHFGENQVPEALEKMQQLQHLEHLQWHFIGQIQRNKTRAIAEHFDWVQSVDRSVLIERLAAQRPGKLAPLNVLIQVNVDAEPQKAGCTPDQAADLCLQVLRHQTLRLRGLMAIPADHDDAGLKQASFDRLARCYAHCQNQCQRENQTADIGLDTLSMGMSGDWQQAIDCGSNMVRIGSAIFGQRNAGSA
ncbi:MAG: YggS family pyridoxal phosphate-dependent enzyme [Gammaproteobacteria bacterium]|nr:YggS family pyridoxal phosphate-dependent enzyme [Gammaproteobacteria bacterium]